ncbi:PIN-like domain-containing protein [Actinokineospora pegani]|uniref:PIN-like domain-containing protein n=1 Tax=Actinokineospora pegani TaxID=2654637 RepID=UPI0012EAEAE5|nr:PIN-like domain-containing protein [Actinokineospora pegani]
MTKGGLYSDFEAYRPSTDAGFQEALREGVLAVDTNVLLNLYRYNKTTVQDLFKVLGAARERLFVPRQVLAEFWRSHQSVIGSLGSARKEATTALAKNKASVGNAIRQWAKVVALPQEAQNGFVDEVEAFFGELERKILATPSSVAVAQGQEDTVLKRLEDLLEGRVGPALSEQEWAAAVAEGARRVANSEPPGYCDAAKADSDLPEGAAGDYLVWRQLLDEGAAQAKDLVLVTSDTKEDWWNHTGNGRRSGPRRELVREYLDATGRRFHLVEPKDLLAVSAVLGVGTDVQSQTDVGRVEDLGSRGSAWTAEAVEMVLAGLDQSEHVQAEVIREAIRNGGRIPRCRLYEVIKRPETTSLKGFTKPVNRVTEYFQAVGVVPEDASALLRAEYTDATMKATHFSVPDDVMALDLQF